MTHNHLQLGDHIAIELFMQSAMACRKFSTHLGRSYATISRKLRPNSSQSDNRFPTPACHVHQRREAPSIRRLWTGQGTVVWGLRD